MKFLVDAQLPPALAGWLRKQGHEAHHVSEIGLLEAHDAVILDRIVATGAVLFTKDRDFVRPTEMQQHMMQVVWVRTGNISTRLLLARLDASWAEVMRHLADKAPLVEFR